jgi:trigger factor
MPEKTTVKRLPKARVECRVVFDAEEVQAAEGRAISNLSSNVRLPGFRPGKAPENLVREKTNPEKLLEETVRELLPAVVKTAAQEHSITPIIPPSIAIEARSPLTIVITFVERPKISVKERAIAIEKKEATVTEIDVDRMLQSLLREHQTAFAVDRLANTGDRVTMDIRGDDEEGKPIPGSEMLDRPVIIGSATLIPGFEDALIGTKAGDRKSFSLKFPEKYHTEHLQGKPVTFHISIGKVEEVKMPELTDAFVKDKFGLENALALRDRIRTSMREQEEMVEKQRREGALFEAILKATTVELANELIADEFRSLLDEFFHSLSETSTTLEQWLKQKGKTQEQLDADMRKRATERLTLRLGIQQLIADKKITVGDEEMKQAIDQLLAPLETSQRLETVPLYAPGARNYVQLKWQKTVEKLMEEMLR